MGRRGGQQELKGVEVCDPDGVEGEIPRLPGLGLLPVSTSMTGGKVTRQVSFRFADDGRECRGYEIHMGRTVAAEGTACRPLNRLEDGTAEGCLESRRCMGTYVHGILDNAAFVDWLLEPLAGRAERRAAFDYAAFREEQYDRLADHVRRHVDVERLYRILRDDD